MKREIKFRAWDGKELKQVDQITIGENIWKCEGGYGVSIPYMPQIVLMQFTGLLDKNGKEIYEGDFLQLEDGGIVKIVYDLVSFSSLVVKKSNTCKNTYLPDWYYCSNYSIIIGNIYEHPNLMQP